MLISPAMEASAGLVAGSHNRNELVVIHSHEEVISLTKKCSGRRFLVSMVNVVLCICLVSCSAAEAVEELGWSSV